MTSNGKIPDNWQKNNKLVAEKISLEKNHGKTLTNMKSANNRDHVSPSAVNIIEIKLYHPREQRLKKRPKMKLASELQDMNVFKQILANMKFIHRNKNWIC